MEATVAACKGDFGAVLSTSPYSMDVSLSLRGDSDRSDGSDSDGSDGPPRAARRGARQSTLSARPVPGASRPLSVTSTGHRGHARGVLGVGAAKPSGGSGAGAPGTSAAARTAHGADGRGADHSRVIIWLDADCFYAQCAMRLHPEFVDVPMGVRQKYLLVTAQYHARRRGVPKMIPVKAALEACPDLVIIDGSELAPFRRASAALLKVAQRCNSLGVTTSPAMDEWVLDITKEVERRQRWSEAEELAHKRRMLEVYRKATEVAKRSGSYGGLLDPVEADREHEGWSGYAYPAPEDPAHRDAAGCACGCADRLRVGAQFCRELRATIFAEVGITTCGGIATCLFAGKHGAEMNKPNQQTVMLPRALPAYLAPLPVRRLPGCGRRFSRVLKQINVETCEQLRNMPLQVLEEVLPAAVAKVLRDMSSGIDPRPVGTARPPVQMGEEDSMGRCDTYKAVKRKVWELCDSLVPRVDNDFRTNGRLPSTIRVHIRHKAADGVNAHYGAATTKQAPLPVDVFTVDASDEHGGGYAEWTAAAMSDSDRSAALAPDRARAGDPRVGRLANAALTVLNRLVDVGKPFNLTVINVTLTDFSVSREIPNCGCDISRLLSKTAQEAPETRLTRSPAAPHRPIPMARRESTAPVARGPLRKMLITAASPRKRSRVDHGDADPGSSRAAVSAAGGSVAGVSGMDAEVPSNVDREVFCSLPKELQDEIRRSWADGPPAAAQAKRPVLAAKRKRGALDSFLSRG